MASPLLLLRARLAAARPPIIHRVATWRVSWSLSLWRARARAFWPSPDPTISSERQVFALDHLATAGSALAVWRTGLQRWIAVLDAPHPPPRAPCYALLAATGLLRHPDHTPDDVAHAYALATRVTPLVQASVAPLWQDDISDPVARLLVTTERFVQVALRHPTTRPTPWQLAAWLNFHPCPLPEGLRSASLCRIPAYRDHVLQVITHAVPTPPWVRDDSWAHDLVTTALEDSHPDQRAHWHDWMALAVPRWPFLALDVLADLCDDAGLGPLDLGPLDTSPADTVARYLPELLLSDDPVVRLKALLLLPPVTAVPAISIPATPGHPADTLSA